MLRKYSTNRTLGDNIKLGVLAALAAGMVNVASFIIFLSFSSNVTGYFAILATELASGNWQQFLLVGFWIFLYFFGNFISTYMVISLFRDNTYLAHSIPLILEIICLLVVGVYCNYYYNETLLESEILLSLLLFSMGLQNGLTTCISNFQVKTTHLTGATTDLGVLASMLLKKKYRQKKALTDKAKLLASIILSYIAGGLIFAYFYQIFEYKMFFVIVAVLSVTVTYDLYKIWLVKAKVIRHKRKISMGMVFSE